MITVKVTFANGNYLITNINATPDEAREYYLGQEFNIGEGGEDNLQPAVNVEVRQAA